MAELIISDDCDRVVEQLGYDRSLIPFAVFSHSVDDDGNRIGPGYRVHLPIQGLSGNIELELYSLHSGLGLEQYVKNSIHRPESSKMLKTPQNLGESKLKTLYLWSKSSRVFRLFCNFMRDTK